MSIIENLERLYGKKQLSFEIERNFFLKYIDTIFHLLNTEVIIQFQKNSIQFDNMDESHITLVFGEITEKSMTKYELEPSITDTVLHIYCCIDLELFYKLLQSVPYRKTTKKSIGKNEFFNIEIYERAIRIILDNKKGSLFLKLISLESLNDNEEFKDIRSNKRIENLNKLQYKNSSIMINREDFQDFLSISKNITMVIAVSVNIKTNQLIFKSENSELYYTFIPTVDSIIKIPVIDANCNNLDNSIDNTKDIVNYELSRLETFINKNKLSFNIIETAFSEDLPIRMKIDLKNDTFIIVYIAPRVEENVETTDT